MEFPMLDGHFSKEDVHSKGKGSFAADYISWAKVAQVVRKHAPGWKCTLVTNEGSGLWAMPDGTCCFIFQWVDPEDNEYDFFPYAITSNNKPVKLEQVNARVFTDNHRRGFCAAACWQFGAAWQLWAREEMADLEAEPEDKPQEKPAPRKTLAKKPKKEKPAEFVEDPPLDPDEFTELMAGLGAIRKSNPDHFADFCVKFRERFGLEKNAPIADKIQTRAHANFCQSFLAEFV